MKTYIVGHKNPDTDSIISPIVLADYYKHLGKDCIPVRAGDSNKEADYILTRFNLPLTETIKDEEKQIILVDTTESVQVHDFVKPEEIIAIYDHHNLAGLKTPKPITARIEPVGCVATVIASLYKEKGFEPDANIAGAAIGAILSDTLKFTSPITTQQDKEMVEWLNTFAKADIDELATEMFKAKSDVSDLTIEELLGKDYKHYQMNGKLVGVGVWESVDPKSILDRKDEIMIVLNKKKQDENLDCVFFGVVDILNNNSDMCILSDKEKEVAEAAFGGKTVDGLMKLNGVVSRKKQMIPPLEAVFAAN